MSERSRSWTETHTYERTDWRAIAMRLFGREVEPVTLEAQCRITTTAYPLEVIPTSPTPLPALDTKP